MTASVPTAWDSVWSVFLGKASPTYRCPAFCPGPDRHYRPCRQKWTFHFHLGSDYLPRYWFPQERLADSPSWRRDRRQQNLARSNRRFAQWQQNSLQVLRSGSSQRFSFAFLIGLSPLNPEE
jgi:hypothetical protein